MKLNIGTHQLERLLLALGLDRYEWTHLSPEDFVVAIEALKARAEIAARAVHKDVESASVTRQTIG
jgi:hypothetical protein